MIKFLFLLALIPFASGLAQKLTAQERYAERLKPTNSWQTVARIPRPVPVEAKAKAVRQATDTFMDEYYGARRPLDREPYQRPTGSHDRIAISEIPDFIPSTTVVATFNDFDTVLSASRRSVYTEERLLIEQVLDTDQAVIRAGGTLSVIESGGTVDLGSGRAIRFEVEPRPEVLEPQHRYLLFLHYSAKGDFFRLVKAWELAEGKALPCSHEDVERAMLGRSEYAGMEESAFLSAVSRRLRGAAWQPVKSAPAQWSLSAIYFRDPKDGWIVGFAGQLLHTADGGVTWESRKTPVNSWLTSITFDSANRGWITTDDGLLTSADGGGTWRLVPATLRFPNKLVKGSGAVWALSPFGMMKQSGTGTEWKKIDNPLSGMA